MADRGGTVAFLSEIYKGSCKPIHLVEVQLDSETIYMTDAYKNIVYSGNTYLAVGYFLQFTDIEESAGMQVGSITGTLTAADNDKYWLSVFLNNSYIDRDVLIYKGFLDANEALVANPVLIFKGKIDTPIIQENPDDGTASISITATNHFTDFEKRPGRYTNHECQQLFFPGDKGFEFASEIIRELMWGRA